MSLTRKDIEDQLAVVRKALASAQRNKDTNRAHKLSAQVKDLEARLREMKED